MASSLSLLSPAFVRSIMQLRGWPFMDDWGLMIGSVFCRKKDAHIFIEVAYQARLAQSSAGSQTRTFRFRTWPNLDLGQAEWSRVSWKKGDLVGVG